MVDSLGTNDKVLFCSGDCNSSCIAAVQWGKAEASFIVVGSTKIDNGWPIRAYLGLGLWIPSLDIVIIWCPVGVGQDLLSAHASDMLLETDKSLESW